MGPWNSDGTFGYSSISVIALEKAAEELEDPNLTTALSCLKEAPEGSRRFIELLETYGPVLVAKIVAAYREGSQGRGSAGWRS
jgi:hypothetical protein